MAKFKPYSYEQQLMIPVSLLLKIILFAYSKGINSSRKIEKFCRENIVCMALAADSRPHFTTIADFIPSMDRECVDLFKGVERDKGGASFQGGKDQEGG